MPYGVTCNNQLTINAYAPDLLDIGEPAGLAALRGLVDGSIQGRIQSSLLHHLLLGPPRPHHHLQRGGDGLLLHNNNNKYLKQIYI